MNFWNIKAFIYKLRSQGLFGRILEQENQSITTMLSPIRFEGLRVVDIGSGLGNSLTLPDIPHLLISIDSSFQMLRKQLPLKPVVARINARAENIPLKTASVDGVFAIGLMEYIKDKQAVIRELSRILKPGSYGVITFSPKNIFTWLRWLQGSPLFPTGDQVNRELLHEQFRILDHHSTLMQQQYFIKKD